MRQKGEMSTKLPSLLDRRHMINFYVMNVSHHIVKRDESTDLTLYVIPMSLPGVRWSAGAAWHRGEL